MLLPQQRSSDRQVSSSSPSGSPALDIRFVPETGSTNADMLALAAEGASEGLWLRAGRQQAGRGRMGRQWEGEEGNLYASTLIRLRPSDPSPPTLALVAAVAVHRALDEFLSRDAIFIKWPNDIMAGSAKCCGMLLERSGDAIVIGIGVNITHAPQLADRQTTSLRDLGALACDAETVLDRIAAHFVELVQQWRHFGVEAIARAWMERAHPAGTSLAVLLPDGQHLSGRFDRLDREGALILRLADGDSRVIHAGDVFLV